MTNPLNTSPCSSLVFPDEGPWGEIELLHCDSGEDKSLEDFVTRQAPLIPLGMWCLGEGTTGLSNDCRNDAGPPNAPE